jgi:hypothetical protein
MRLSRNSVERTEGHRDPNALALVFFDEDVNAVGSAANWNWRWCA